MKRLNDGIKLCVAQGDNASRDLAERILTDEEDHIDWLEAQLHAIGEMGIGNYLAEQLKKTSSCFASVAGGARHVRPDCQPQYATIEKRRDCGASARRLSHGEMAEWLKAHAWKACVLERVPRVRIPVSPPYFQ